MSSKHHSSKQQQQQQSQSAKLRWQITLPTTTHQQKQLDTTHWSSDSLVIESPLGFSDITPTTTTATTSQQQQQQSSDQASSSSSSTAVSRDRELKEKKVWELARSPMGNLALKCFLMYMSGNQIHIFPILITAMALMDPLKALLATNSVFEMFEKEKIPTLLPKLIYILLNAVGLGVAMAKCYWLGVFDGGAYQPVPLSSQISFHVQ